MLPRLHNFIKYFGGISGGSGQGVKYSLRLELTLTGFEARLLRFVHALYLVKTRVIEFNLLIIKIFLPPNIYTSK